MFRRFLVGLTGLSLLAFFVVVLSPSSVRADGTYFNIGTTNSNNGSSDAVSWSQANPFMVDNYNHYIVPIYPVGASGYKFAYSNNQGTTWAEDDSVTMPFRTSAVYDSINDKIHIAYGDSSGIEYKRFVINRDGSNNITGFTQDSSLTPINLDNLSSGACSSVLTFFPEILFKNTGANGIIVVIWDANKTCGGNKITEVRGSMRALSNTSADGTAGNWSALNGSTDGGSSSGPANVAYNILYQDTTVTQNVQHASLIRGGSGNKASDIYFFNNDTSDFAGFRRLAWNSSSSNWSGTWTTRAAFGPKQDSGNGYGGKHDLMTKPIYASGQSRVYIGLAVWLEGSNTKGDTQSLYYVDTTDNTTDLPALAQNIYSAGGTHCIYPTMDISYDSTNNQVYYFYDASGASSVCGNAYYKTYDGHTLSSAQPFYTVANRSVDIPITYPYTLNGKIQLFFRLNNASTPGSQPHEIYYGYVPVTASATPTPLPASSGTYSADTTTDFDKTCALFTSTGITDITNGEVANLDAFRDDFDSSSLFNNYWGTGVWSSGSFSPTISGSVLVYGSGGAYAISSSFYQYKTVEFRAKFTNNNFQHIGFTDSTAFNNFILFSTKNNGQLNTRVYTFGGAEVGTTLGTSYYGSYHTYKIVWSSSSVTFYIDGTLVDTQTTGIPPAKMGPIMSNNDSSVGSDLTIDWIRIPDAPSTAGTYQSCTLDSSVTNAVWGAFTYNTTLPSSTSVSVQTRTSSDNSSWSSWSSNLSSGGTVSSNSNRYLQFLVSLTGVSTDTPSFNNMTVLYSTPTPTPTTTVSTSSSSQVGAPPCTNSVPGTPNLKAAEFTSPSSVKVTFDKPAGNYDKIAVEYGTSPDKFEFAADNVAGASDTSFNVGFLDRSKIYYFHIRAGNGCQPGLWSDIVNTQIVTPKFPVVEIPAPLPTPKPTSVPAPKVSEAPQTLPSEYEVHLDIKDQNGNPLGGATVTLHSEPKIATTDTSGKATFYNVEPGQHSLQISYAGFVAQKTITVTGSNPVVEITVKAELNQNSKIKYALAGAGTATVVMVLVFLTVRRKRK